MRSRSGDEVAGGGGARRGAVVSDLGQAAGLRRNRGHAGSMAAVATTPANRELAEGRRAVALPLVVMDMLFFAELLVTEITLLGDGHETGSPRRPDPDLTWALMRRRRSRGSLRARRSSQSFSSP